MNANDVAYILLGVILVASFIAVFFFTYVSKVEEAVVRNQVSDNIDDLADGSRLWLGTDALQAISNVIDNEVKMPDMTKEDEEVRLRNKELKTKALLWFGIGIGVGLIVLLLMRWRYKLEMKEILKFSLITLCLVALTEYLFVTIVSKNYVVVDPNYVRYLIAKNFQQYARS